MAFTQQGCGDGLLVRAAHGQRLVEQRRGRVGVERLKRPRFIVEVPELLQGAQQLRRRRVGVALRADERPLALHGRGVGGCDAVAANEAIRRREAGAWQVATHARAAGSGRLVVGVRMQRRRWAQRRMARRGADRVALERSEHVESLRRVAPVRVMARVQAMAQRLSDRSFAWPAPVRLPCASLFGSLCEWQRPQAALMRQAGGRFTAGPGRRRRSSLRTNVAEPRGGRRDRRWRRQRRGPAS
jgi:hypothetical protein